MNSDLIKKENDECDYMNHYPKSWNIKNVKYKNFKSLNQKDLLKLLRNEAPKGYFELDKEYEGSKLFLKKLGSLKYGNKIYHLVYSQLFWGNARVTERLIFISEKFHYLGDYYITGLATPRLLNNSVLIGKYKLPLNKNCPKKEVYL